MKRLVQRTGRLIAPAPTAVLHAALPGALVLAASLWMIQRSLLQWDKGAFPAPWLSLAGVFLGIWLLGFALHRVLLRQDHAPALPPRSLVWAALRYLIHLAMLCLILSAVFVVLKTAMTVIEPITLALVAMAADALSPPSAAPGVRLFTLLLTVTGIALHWLALLPVIWLVLRLGLTLPAAAAQTPMTPRASWIRTTRSAHSLFWAAFGITLIGAALSMITMTLYTMALIESLPPVNADGLGSLIGSLNTAPPPEAVMLLITASVAVTLTVVLTLAGFLAALSNETKGAG